MKMKNLQNKIIGEVDSEKNRVPTLLAKLNDKTSLFILLFFSILCFLPGIFSISAVDREETNIVLTSQQMLENSNYFSVHDTYPDNVNPKIGTFWLQVVSAKFVGSGSLSPIWVYRFPSLFGALITVFAVFWCVRAFVGPPVALLATLLTSSTLLMAVTSRMSNSDALTLTFIVLTQCALARIWINAEMQKLNIYVFIFWFTLSASFLIDGPFGPMILFLTIFGLSFASKGVSWIQRLKPVMGFLLSLTITIPWIIITDMEAESVFSIKSVTKDIFGRLGHGIDNDGVLPLTHFLIMQLTFWPLSAFVILTIPSIFHNRKSPTIMFFLAWAIPSWIVLELVAYKTPNLTLPILPAIATLTAIALTSWENNWRTGRWIAAIIMIMVPLIYLGLSIGVPVYLDDEISILGVLVCCFSLLFATVSAFQILWNYHLILSLFSAFFATLILSIGFLGFTVPSFSSFRLNETLNNKISDVTTCSDPRIGIIGYNELGLSFYIGEHIVFDSIEHVASWISQTGCKVAIIEENHLERFQTIRRNYYDKSTFKAEISGFDYNSGKMLKFHIYQSNISDTQSTF